MRTKDGWLSQIDQQRVYIRSVENNDSFTFDATYSDQGRIRPCAVIGWNAVGQLYIVPEGEHAQFVSEYLVNQTTQEQ